MSGAIGESSNAAVCLDEHKEQTASDLCDIEECINEAQQTLDRIEDFVQCGEGDWRRVVRDDYTNSLTQCPTVWQEIMVGVDRFCGRMSATADTCDSASFLVDGEYNRVCGRIHAFHAGQAVSFAGTNDIETAYLTGLSLTHGAPTSRQHIWSFAIGETEDSSVLVADGAPERLCPCHDDGDPTTPTFVGSDFFCEAALDDPFDSGTQSSTPFLDDLLWDGCECTDEEDCCGENGPPFFYTILPFPTTDDLEIRMCLPTAEANVLVQLVEIYVM